MRYFYTFILLLVTSLSALAQPKEITIMVGDTPIEMVRVDPGSVMLPVRTGYTVQYANTGQILKVSGSQILPAQEKSVSEAYYIGKYPVTMAQWNAITTGQNHLKGEKAKYPMSMFYTSDKGVDDNYVNYVQFFTEKLNEKTGLGFSLPTLEQWLLACGPIPEDIEKYAWIDGSKNHPVGAKLPNKNGIYDMLGLLGEMFEVEVIPQQQGEVIRGFDHYIGVLPVAGAAAKVKKDPSRLLKLQEKGPISGAWPPTFRLVLLDDVAEDCPGILKAAVLKEDNKFGLETEYGVVLKANYDEIKFAPGTGFYVCKDGRWGICDRKGETVLPLAFESEQSAGATLVLLPHFSFRYARKALETELAGTKGEFEKEESFRARRSDPSLQQTYLDEHLKGFTPEAFIESVLEEFKQTITFKPYDTEKEGFPFQLPGVNPWEVFFFPVPIADAPAFKEYVSSLSQAERMNAVSGWCLVDNLIQPVQVSFTLPDGRSFTYQNPRAE
jgi:hypothetical protein